MATACSPVCSQFLTASRKVAEKRKGWTDRACSVTGDSRLGYTIEAFDGTIVWEGTACCEHGARSEAISKNADQPADYGMPKARGAK
jgi:hypothetical protein